jgi:hypothetical protein
MISFIKRKKLSCRARRSAKNEKHGSFSVRFVPLGKIPADSQNHPSIAVFSNGCTAAFSED